MSVVLSKPVHSPALTQLGLMPISQACSWGYNSTEGHVIYMNGWIQPLINARLLRHVPRVRILRCYDPYRLFIETGRERERERERERGHWDLNTDVHGIGGA